MNIHAIQTGTVAVKESQQQGSRGDGAIRLLNTMLNPTWTEALPIYAWVIEHPEGIIVIDTGETAQTAEAGYLPWWHPYFKLGMKASVTPEEEIGPQLRRLGIPPEEVRWVIMNHLHTDHAGGLYHFPKSEILVSRTEYELAASFSGRMRGYLSNHWPDWFDPHLIDFRSEPFRNFQESLSVTEAGDVRLVPTPGHSGGHLSVIFRTIPYPTFLRGMPRIPSRVCLTRSLTGLV